jgi:predicted dehydrogenase
MYNLLGVTSTTGLIVIRIMRQVVQNSRTGKLALRQVPAPRVTSGHLLVRTRASLISAGTERMMVQFARKSLFGKARARPDLVKKVISKARRDGLVATARAVFARLDEPLPLGYSAAGEIVAVGAGLEGRFRVGQRVAIAGAGLANHADLNLIPANLTAPIPDDVPEEEACFGTLATIALHGVRLLGTGVGDAVGIVGVGLVGQLAAQLLSMSGARVIAIDYDADRLALAQRLGAEAVWNLADGSPTEAVLDLSGGLGCDGILIAAASNSSEPLAIAASIARDRARVSLVGITGTEFPYREFMKKELTVTVSRSYGPGRYDDDYERRGLKYPEGYVRWTETENLKECLRRMSPRLRQWLDVRSLVTHSFDFANAEEAYGLVTEGREPHLGVVLRYPPEADGSARMQSVIAIPVAGGRDRCVLGVIGAGTFARTMLLPTLKTLPACELHTVVTRRGISAGHNQDLFGFSRSSTDAAAVLDEPAINAVLIATPHSTHAELTARALAAGKCVFVEKPLALNREQLSSVIAARNVSPAFFQVGFNRRFAPMVRKARDHLARIGGRKFVVLRVNAGKLAPDSWQRSEEEGRGRALGELCHFVDLAAYLVGAPITAVQADAARVDRGLCEDLTVTLQFADGSLGTVAYTSLGDTAFSKELFECYAGGTVVTIDNFRRMAIVVDGKSKTQRGIAEQDKGHKSELRAFVEAVVKGGPPPVDENELLQSSLATIAVLESLQTGDRVPL